MPTQPDSTSNACTETPRPSEECYRLLMDGVKDYAILMLDPTGHVVTWNTWAEHIKGYRAAEAIGKHFSLFVNIRLTRVRASASCILPNTSVDSPSRAFRSAISVTLI